MGGRGQGAATYPEANEEKMTTIGQGWSLFLNDKEYKSTRAYTGSDYYQMNKFLRSGVVPSYETKQSLTEQTDAIANGISRFVLPRNITVYRGASGKSMFGTDLDGVNVSDFNAMYKGAILQDRGFASTSIRKGREFSKSVLYEIRVPKGTGRGAYVAPISSHETEKEFLIQKDSYFKINGARMDRDKMVITMTVIPVPTKEK